MLAAYLLYFVGISSFVGPEKVMELGDVSVSFMASTLLGDWAAKLILVLVIISVMGTVNGIVLGFIRLPYALALRNAVPLAGKLSKLDDKSDNAVNSGYFSMAICLVWWVIHYVTMRYGFLPGSDVSEIAIVMSYIMYVTLYYQVFKLWRKKEVVGVVKGVVYPVLATLGSLFILFAGLQNPLFFYYVAICLLAMIGGYIYAPKKI